MALLKNATTALEHWRILQRGQEKELMKARERLLDETGKKDGCGGCWRAAISEGKEERRKEGKGSQQEWSAPVSWWLSVMEVKIDRGESTSGVRIRRRGMPSIVAVSQKHHYLNFYWTWKRLYQDGHRREMVQGRGESLREDKIMPIDAGKKETLSSKGWVLMGMMSLRGKETKGEKQLKKIFKFFWRNWKHPYPRRACSCRT